jgi:hypothetical protein
MRCGCGAAAEIPIPNLRRLAVLRRRGSRKQPRTAHGPAANPEQPQHSCADQRRFSDGGRGEQMKTDWIRTNIIDIVFVFIFMSGFEFEYE